MSHLVPQFPFASRAQDTEPHRAQSPQDEDPQSTSPWQGTDCTPFPHRWGVQVGLRAARRDFSLQGQAPAPDSPAKNQCPEGHFAATYIHPALSCPGTPCPAGPAAFRTMTWSRSGFFLLLWLCVRFAAALRQEENPCPGEEIVPVPCVARQEQTQWGNPGPPVAGKGEAGNRQVVCSSGTKCPAKGSSEPRLASLAPGEKRWEQEAITCTALSKHEPASWKERN